MASSKETWEPQFDKGADLTELQPLVPLVNKLYFSGPPSDIKLLHMYGANETFITTLVNH